MTMHKLPLPYVAFFQGPDGRNDRFLLQGMIDREAIGCAVQVLVDLLDVMDGDPDLEDATDLEDDFAIYTVDIPSGPGCLISDAGGVHDEDGINTLFRFDPAGGAGCPIADPGGCQHDGREPEDGC